MYYSGLPQEDINKDYKLVYLFKIILSIILIRYIIQHELLLLILIILIIIILISRKGIVVEINNLIEL